MKKSDIRIIPEYGLQYANLASDENLLVQLESGGLSLFLENRQKLEQLSTKIYAHGKWTVAQIIEHLSDAERIFQYRALRFARQDKTELSGFDEELYAAVSKASDRSIDDLLEEYQCVRKSTYALYKTFDNDQLLFSGKANGQDTSVIALGFMMIGHSIHHYRVIEERYFPLIDL